VLCACAEALGVSEMILGLVCLPGTKLDGQSL